VRPDLPPSPLSPVGYRHRFTLYPTGQCQKHDCGHAQGRAAENQAHFGICRWNSHGCVVLIKMAFTAWLLSYPVGGPGSIVENTVLVNTPGRRDWPRSGSKSRFGPCGTGFAIPMAAVSTELELATRLGYAGPKPAGNDFHRLAQNFVGPGLGGILWLPRSAAEQTAPHRAPLPIRSIHGNLPYRTRRE